jgi:hypothetical protein
MKKFDLRYLRSIILEQVEELFAEPDAAEEATRLGKSSADDQIDSFILKFEKDSISADNADSQSLNESLKNLSLSALLLEQELPDDPDDLAGDEEAPAEEETTEEETTEEETTEDPEPSDSTDSDVEAAKSLPKPPLDIDAFTKRVARLAMNYDNLLDMKAIIVNRAMNFLLENYDKIQADEMRDILDSQFDFDLDGGAEIPEAPFAVGAYGAGTGQMGGGGG